VVGSSQRSPVGHAPDRILWDVVEEHLDEVEFLFELWRNTLDASHYTLAELRKGPEMRLLAHLDGLRVGGEVVVQRLLEPALADEGTEPLRAAAVALAMFTATEPGRGRTLVQRLPALAEPVQAGVAWALAACDRPDLATVLTSAIAQGTGALPAMLLEVSAARAEDVQGVLDPLMHADDPATRIAVARACGVDRRRLPWVERATIAGDEALRDAALPTALTMGSEHAWQLVGRLALDAKLVHRDAMTWMAQLGEPRLVDALAARLSDEGARADVLWALGFSGRVAAADACLQWLGDEDFGPLAGEAFAGITGIDVHDDAYWEDAVPTEDVDGELPPLAQDLEAELVVAPEEELRPPKPDAIAKWWVEHRGRFAPEQRWIAGQPAQLDGFLHALRTESMRRRHARAFELLVRSQGRARVPTRMMSSAQQRAIEACTGAGRVDGNRPFSKIGAG
jgi:uncharacterized protein (TIGR02270 family)